VSAPNVVSISFYPRYKTVAGLPVVVEACRRVLYDNSVIQLSTITAAAYHDACGDETDALCAALDRHPRERR
jgi:hypothetical protein